MILCLTGLMQYAKIKLFNIYEITKQIFDEHKVIQNPTIDEIFEVDETTREKTRELIVNNIAIK